MLPFADQQQLCPSSFLPRALPSCCAGWILRQHLGNARGELVGKRKKLGVTKTGTVYEQALVLKSPDGRSWTVRRITVRLISPTRDKERLIHILSNLPAKVSGRTIADMYCHRWKIETVFQDLATVLRGEVNTLGYPKAALLGFCLALVTFNLLSMIKAAIRTAHRRTAPEKISTYYLANEIASTLRGMEIAIPARHWTQTFAAMSSHELATILLGIAKHVQVSAFATHAWSKKRKQPPRKSGHRGNHVSTHRLLKSPVKPFWKVSTASNGWGVERAPCGFKSRLPNSALAKGRFGLVWLRAPSVLNKEAHAQPCVASGYDAAASSTGCPAGCTSSLLELSRRKKMKATAVTSMTPQKNK